MMNWTQIPKKINQHIQDPKMQKEGKHRQIIKKNTKLFFKKTLIESKWQKHLKRIQVFQNEIKYVHNNRHINQENKKTSHDQIEIQKQNDSFNMQKNT